MPVSFFIRELILPLSRSGRPVLNELALRPSQTASQLILTENRPFRGDFGINKEGDPF